MNELVSCILATGNRPNFLRQALRCFERQTYDRSELIAIDDGEPPAADLCEGLPRIRYVRLDEPTSLGRKLNIGVQRARGTIIQKLDDDDYYHPEFLERAVASLPPTNRARTLVAWDCFLVLLVGDPHLRHSGHGWAAGGTLCFGRELWERAPFRDVPHAVDHWFLKDHHPKIIRVCAPELYLLVRHGHNTWKRIQNGPVDDFFRRLPIYPKAIDELVEPPDREFYHSLASGVCEVNVATAEPVLPVEPTPDAEGEPVASIRRSGSHVTVSVPYFRTPQTLRRAVESILNQTHADLTLVVVNDGDEPPWHLLKDVDDPRLVCFDLQQNHGRYFVDAVVLDATDAPYFLVQDADDWSEPQRIATLLRHLRAAHASGAVSAQRDHDPAHPRRANVVAQTHDFRVPLDTTFKLRMRHHGLYRTNALRAIGGCYGGFRIAYDMLLVNFLLMTGGLIFVDQPLYHRTIRTDSLTVAPDTGMRSAARRQVTAQLGQIYAEALHAYNAYLAGELERADLCREIRQLCNRHVTPEDRAALEAESRRLRERLAAAARPAPARPTRGRSESPGALIDDPRLRWSGWAIGRAVALEMQQYLEAAKPKRILEIGSGTSTVLLADYAARHQATLVSLGHESNYQEQTSRLLQEFDLRAQVDLRLAPLQPLWCPDGRCYPWYATDLTGSFDFVFIDGPPLRHGRQAAFFAIATHLARRWVVWLHDAARDHERECVALWSRFFTFQQALSHPEPRGLLELSAPDPLAMPDRTPSDLGVSLLTGGRLGLLRRTIATLEAQSPGLLEQSVVVALVNGDDPQTQAYLEKQPFVDQCLVYSQGILPIGDATSRLMQALLAEGVEMILHLEDDWKAETTDPHWLQRAQGILRTHPTVGQMRLRHSRERVLPYHMVTQQPIRWERRDGFMLAPSAHYTFNPSLIWARDVPEIFPCRSEHEAQINFLRLGAATIQLLPGVFHHIGVHQRRRT